MRTFFLAFLFAALAAGCQSKSSEAPAEVPAELAYFGATFTPSTPVSSTELSSRMSDGQELSDVQVEGQVLAACAMKGCWMTMPLADGKEMRVTFKDYGFFVPKDCAGQTAIIQGKAYYDTTSVEDLRHYAVDGGMSEDEAAAKYTEPEISISFEATGVALKPADKSSAE